MRTLFGWSLMAEGEPVTLVSRRPDLVVAERRLAAADSRVAAAKAARYPRLALTASGGTATHELSDLLDGDFSVCRSPPTCCNRSSRAEG